MPKKPLLVCFDWKMNPTSLTEATTLFETYKNSVNDNHNVVVFPPAIYLHSLESSNIKLGAQDFAFNSDDGYNGQLSASHFADASCQYALVGQNRIRTNQKLANHQIHQKTHKAWEAGLIPILCVTIDTIPGIYSKLKNELESVFHGKDVLDGGIVVAFENTGKAPMNIKQVEHFLAFIKLILREKGYEDIPVLYGGNVNPSNVAELSTAKNLDGFLFSNPSVDSNDLKKIFELV